MEYIHHALESYVSRYVWAGPYGRKQIAAKSLGYTAALYFTETLSCGGLEGTKKNDSKIPMGSYTEFPPIPLSLCVPTHLQMRTLARQLFVFMCWFPMCSLYSLPWSQVQSVFCVHSFIRYNTKRQNAQMEWFTRLISFGNSKMNFEVILVCMFCSFLRVMELAT